MKLLLNNVLGGNKLNCFKATQVLGDLTQILIWGSGFPIVGGHKRGVPPYDDFFLKSLPPKPMPPMGVPPPRPLKNEAPPLKHETPFHEMIPIKSTINNNLKSC